MANLFELSATLGLDTSEFTESINSARTTARQAQQEFQQTFNQTSTQTQQSANTASTALQNMFSFSGAQLLTNAIQMAASAVKQFAAESISAASDLVEVQNVVDVTFGSSTDTINAWSKAAANAYGLSETKAKQYTSTIGAMLKSMGLDGEEITRMSTDLAGLAADMASFYNLDYDESFSKIRSGLSGETEPLKQLGVNMSVANLEAYALAQGVETAYDKMSQAEQATLRYQYLLDATKDAQGDFSRTSDSYSNEMRKLETNLERIKADFGQGLLAVVTPALSLLNNVLSDNSYQYTDVEQIVRERDASLLANDNAYAYAQGILDTMEGMTDASGDAVSATDSWRNALEALLDVFPGLSKYVDLTTYAITDNTGEIEKYVSSLYGLEQYDAQKAALDALQAEYNSAASAYQEARDALEQHDLKQQGQAKVDQNNLQAGWKTFATSYAQLFGADEWSADAFVWGTDEAQLMYESYLDLVDGIHNQYALDQYAAGASGIKRHEEYNAFKALLDGSGSAVDTEREALQAEVDAALETLDEAEAALKAQQEVYNEFVSSDAGAAASAQSEFGTRAEAEITAIDNVKDALSSLKEYYQSTYEEILETYRGTVTQFGYMVTYTEEEMNELLRTTYSTENVTNWWGNNADTLNTYVDQLEDLRAQGISDDILGNLTTWSKENSALVARYWQMIMSGEYSAEDINADFARGQSAEERAAQFATSLQLDNDPEYQALLDSADQFVEAFNIADAATAEIASASEAVLMGIDSLNAELQPKIAETQALLDSLFGADTYTLNNSTADLSDFGGRQPTARTWLPTDFSLYELPESHGTSDTSSARMSYIRRDRLPELPESTGAQVVSSSYSYIRNDKTPVPNASQNDGITSLFSLYGGASSSTDAQEVVDLGELFGEPQRIEARGISGSLFNLLDLLGGTQSSGEKHGGGGRSFGDSYETQESAMQWQTLGSDGKAVELSAESVAAIAAAVSGVSISNTFEVDGQAIAVQIAPMVNKQIGGGVRYNLLTTKD